MKTIIISKYGLHELDDSITDSGAAKIIQMEERISQDQINSKFKEYRKVNHATSFLEFLVMEYDVCFVRVNKDNEFILIKNELSPSRKNNLLLETSYRKMFSDEVLMYLLNYKDNGLLYSKTIYK